MAPYTPAPSKITLFLMTGKGFRVLEHIVANLDKSLVAVVVGARDEQLANDYFAEIRALCVQENIPFLSRSEATAVAPTDAVAVAWRWLIPNAGRLIVLHDSLLPRYRGFAPLVSCLLNGEPEIGVTALYATAEFDRGPVLAQAARPVQYPIRIAEAIGLAVECYQELVTQLWPALESGQLPPGAPQQEEDATYSLWRDEKDYRIDWQQDSAYLRRFVDALGWPYRGASTLLGGHIYRVLAAEVVPDVVIENRAPGKVLFLHGSQPVVVCGSGLLRLTELRTDEGGQALPLARFRSRFE